MKTETTHTNVEVDVTINFNELEQLILNGELDVEPDVGPDLKIIYDQREGTTKYLHDHDGDFVTLAMAQRDLVELLDGVPAEWQDHPHADVEVTMEYEADPNEGKMPVII